MLAPIPADVRRLLELAVCHFPCCGCAEEAHVRLVRDMIVSLSAEPLTIVLDTPSRVALVVVPRLWTVYDLLRLFGSVHMIATRTMVVGEPLPIDKTLAELLIREDEVIFLRACSSPAPSRGDG